MVHPGGFEPPTARFVAEYSIQLSYGCKMAVRRGFEPRMQLLTAYSLSRGAPSASRPPSRMDGDAGFEPTKIRVKAGCGYQFHQSPLYGGEHRIRTRHQTVRNA